MITDRSKKGSIDADIKPLLEVINSKDGYTTTSSCSGRIVLLDIPKAGDKKNAEWIYTTHEKANGDEVSSIVKNSSKQLWFLQEPMILHAQCRTIEHADRLLKIAQSCGFKRSGIFSLKRLSVEIHGAERIETLLTPELPREYVLRLVDEANLKLQRTKQNMQKFQERLKLIP